LIKLGVN